MCTFALVGALATAACGATRETSPTTAAPPPPGPAQVQSSERGVVSGVKRPGRIERAGSLTLSFDQIVVRGREIPMRAMATQVFRSGGIREGAGTIGAGAGVGVVVGGILWSERSYGTFCRVVSLPPGAIADSAMATFSNGVLDVTVQAPSPEMRRGRKIDNSGA